MQILKQHGERHAPPDVNAHRAPGRVTLLIMTQPESTSGNAAATARGYVQGNVG